MPLLKNLIRSDELLVETVDIKHRFYASSAEPLTHKELIAMANNNGDQHLVDLYNDHSLGYAENGGSLDLRQEIAKLYGAKITADNIVVFPGAQTGMTLTTQTVLDKSDHSIIVTPSYQSLEEGVIIAGGGFTRVALSPDNDWNLELDAVEAAIQYNTKYIVLNDPHNPSGALMNTEDKRALIALAEKNNLQILSDEVYRLLELDPSDRSASMAEMSKNAIALGTMAKPYGAGGMCIGWVVCQDKDFIKNLLKTQHIYAVCFSRAGEIQAMMALRSSDDIIKRNMDIIKDNLILLDEFFAEYSDLFEWVYPKAGGTGFAKFKGPLTGDQLAAELQENEILVFGPSIFDCEEGLGQYIRIGFSRRTMPAALEAFKEFVDQRRAEWKL
ncbi:MAG: pyridoxal phosphate-dependent aminotransferase [Kordiimonadaceae bacterium]|jgi:aspartate/methionine/tyrosine aminotransferase|nr:pyridoxal phosphate-dependent aminotransferase [Kordiimonadaceae bacterium]MBT6033166.1 pyridoxal phosphate-dependent aminotransferase [Kordiimonadaceae bacterium]